MTTRFRLPFRSRLALAVALVAAMVVAMPAAQADAAPVLGGALPEPLPLFPADNWWNVDVSQAPIDPGSAGFIGFINNGGQRRLHPDFGGEVSPGSVQTYGMPYVVVDGTQPRLVVDFVLYGHQSDGVGVPFYPIPAEAITQPHWIEGGEPGNVDRRTHDRHLLIVDRDRNWLYELYNVYYNAASGQWEAGSGAFFDMNANDRRPEGWTSADAAGLAILPGLVRYDEVFDPSVSEIEHAFRVTVRATNGYVYPASHRAGSTAGALPMGARLRLKASVDISHFTPELQKIFRAMKRYGLIIADNGSDMYITGTFDTRWDNDVLNPAFRALTASDFEVVQLGWRPSGDPDPDPVAVAALGVSPSSVTGGQAAAATVTLDGPAPAGGAVVALSSTKAATASVPASVTVAAGATAATFAIGTTTISTATSAEIRAAYGGQTRAATLTVTPAVATPPAVTALRLNPTTVVGGGTSTATVTLARAAPAGGTPVTIASSKPGVASAPATVTVPAGASTATFAVSTTPVTNGTAVVLSATSTGAAPRTATLTVTLPSTAALALSASAVTGGGSVDATVTLTGPAPAGGIVVMLRSSRPAQATVPPSVTVAAGQTSATFTVTTTPVSANTSALISATYRGATKNATLTIRR